MWDQLLLKKSDGLDILALLHELDVLLLVDEVHEKLLLLRRQLRGDLVENADALASGFETRVCDDLFAEQLLVVPVQDALAEPDHAIVLHVDAGLHFDVLGDLLHPILPQVLLDQAEDLGVGLIGHRRRFSALAVKILSSARGVPLHSHRRLRGLRISDLTTAPSRLPLRLLALLPFALSAFKLLGGHVGGLAARKQRLAQISFVRE